MLYIVLHKISFSLISSTAPCSVPGDRFYKYYSAYRLLMAGRSEKDEHDDGKVQQTSETSRKRVLSPVRLFD